MSAAPGYPDLADAFTRIEPLKAWRIDDFNITALPGYTNRNYRLQNDDHDWVLRIPKPDTNTYIDRAAETHNQARAAGLGLAPTVVWRDNDGLSLTPALPGRALLTEDLVDPQTRCVVADSLRRLHAQDHAFIGHVDPGELIPRYYWMTPPAAQQDLSDRWREAQVTLRWLEGRDLPAVPSHNDLILENLLLDGERLWMIDWEFSAMASPYWDLATLCNAARLTPAQAVELMRDYCAETLPMEESMLCAYRDLLQLLSDCWMVALVPEAP